MYITKNQFKLTHSEASLRLHLQGREGLRHCRVLEFDLEFGRRYKIMSESFILNDLSNKPKPPYSNR